jgi:hypothetical protein
MEMCMTGTATYTLEELIARFQVEETEAERIYRITGPQRADVDAFMRVRQHKEGAEQWIMDLHIFPQSRDRQP